MNLYQLAAGLLLAFLGDRCQAGDWPQILGPNRDGRAVGEELLDDWPKEGPREIWQMSVGQGFSGIAVGAGRAYLFHRVGDNEVLECMDAVTGEPIWSSKSACRYSGGYSGDSGPRCVPVINGDSVFVFGVAGRLRRVSLKDGSEVWSRDTWQDFEAPEGYFGAGSTPIVVGNLVVVNVGGRKDSAIVAFERQSGATAWKSFTDTASYSSPISATIDGTQHLIAVTRMHTVSLDPDNGAIRWKFPFGMRGPTVNGATPVKVGGHVFVSSSYRVGSVLAKVGRAGVETTASGETLLATQYATPVQHKGLLYAVDGRQDQSTASLKCLDPIGQKILWEESGFEYGTMVGIGDHLLFLTCGGELIRIKAASEGLDIEQKCQVLQSTPRGHRLPAISNGLLYVRDADVLKCVHVGVR